MTIVTKWYYIKCSNVVIAINKRSHVSISVHSNISIYTSIVYLTTRHSKIARNGLSDWFVSFNTSKVSTLNDCWTWQPSLIGNNEAMTILVIKHSEFSINILTYYKFQKTIYNYVPIYILQTLPFLNFHTFERFKSITNEIF